MKEEGKEGVEKKRRLRWALDTKLVDSTSPPEGGIALIHGRHAYLELEAPHMALRNSSKVTVYAQTEAGRKAAGNRASGFDINVPGTVELTGNLETVWKNDQWHGVRAKENRADWESRNYVGGHVEWSGSGLGARVASLELGKNFRLSVPLVADVLPLRGVLSKEEKADLKKQIEVSRSASTILAQSDAGLVVRPGEKVFFGFQYKDAEGKDQWLTASAKVTTHPLFAIMDEDHRHEVTSA